MYGYLNVLDGDNNFSYRAEKMHNKQNFKILDARFQMIEVLAKALYVL